MAKKQGKQPKYKLNYPEFTPRSYGVAITGARGSQERRNKPFIDPASFFIARWYLNTPMQKLQMIRKWLREVSKPAEERGYAPVFTFDRKVVVDVGEQYKDGRQKRSRRLLTQLTAGELARNSRQRVFSQNRSYNLYDLSLEKIFFLDDEEKKERWPVVKEGIWLAGCMKRKQGGRTIREFDKASIAGPFENSRIPLARVECDCEDSVFAATKQGYSPLEYFCTSAASLLYLAWRQPSAVRGLRELQKSWKGAKPWLPFNPQRVQSIPKGLYTVKEGEQPPLEVLVVDARFDLEFNGATKYEVSKKLARVAVTYHRMLWEMIYDGLAGFEVLPSSYVVARSNPMQEQLRQWYNRYRAFLEREGFSEAGNVVEKKDSPYEVVAMRFVNKNGEERRILFSHEYPPVVIVRRQRKGVNPDVFHEEKRKEPFSHKHPFEEIFQPKQMFDDYSRRMMNYEVVIPTEVYIPDEMVADYSAAVTAFFPGGASKLIPKVQKRGGLEYMSRIMTIVAQAKRE